jgi:DNA-binding transcriptional MerR regulator
LGGLVIVQNRETQFDAPLYRVIAGSAAYPLRVIYTAALQGADDELGFAPRWDHLASGSYDQWVLQGQSPLQAWRLARWIRSLKPDLVIVAGYYPRFQLLLALLLRLRGQRIGLRSDNTLRHTHLIGWRGWVRRQAVGRIQRLFHSWHPVGNQALAYLRELSGTDRPSYRFAYAVDNHWFASRSAVERSGRAEWLTERGWPADAFVVLGILKWTTREDPLTLVRAFAQLQRPCPRARLLLVLRGKRLGFSLAEIREFLDLYDTDRTQVSQAQMLLGRVRSRIEELEQQKRDLDQTLKELLEVEHETQAALRNRGALPETTTKNDSPNQIKNRAAAAEI